MNPVKNCTSTLIFHFTSKCIKFSSKWMKSENQFSFFLLFTFGTNSLNNWCWLSLSFYLENNQSLLQCIPPTLSIKRRSLSFPLFLFPSLPSSLSLSLSLLYFYSLFQYLPHFYLPLFLTVIWVSVWLEKRETFKNFSFVFLTLILCSIQLVSFFFFPTSYQRHYKLKACISNWLIIRHWKYNWMIH